LNVRFFKSLHVFELFRFKNSHELIFKQLFKSGTQRVNLDKISNYLTKQKYRPNGKETTEI
jgi:hypothetical protein